MIGLLLAIAGWSAAPPDPVGACGPDPAAEATERYAQLMASQDSTRLLAFADCLEDLGLLHAAQHHAVLAMRVATTLDLRDEALMRAFALADAIGDPRSLLDEVPVARVRVDGPGRDALLLDQGEWLIREGRHQLGAVRLDEVSPDSRWRRAATLAKGHALELAGQPTEALKAYAELTTGPEAGEARVREAVVLMRLGRHEASLQALGALAADPRYQGDAGLFAARLLLRTGRVDEADRLVARLRRLDPTVWAPGAEVVGAEVDVEACRSRRATRHLERFDAIWRPDALALDAIHLAAADRPARLWDDLFGPDPVDLGLSPAVRAHLAAGTEPVRGWLEGHLARVDAELDAIARIDSAEFQWLVAPDLVQVELDGRERLRLLLGQVLVERISRTTDELQELRADANLLKGRIGTGPCG